MVIGPFLGPWIDWLWPLLGTFWDISEHQCCCLLWAELFPPTNTSSYSEVTVTSEYVCIWKLKL